ncbi:MAG TPA: PilZ domain-containing protein [Candidatus Polarisedimenticolia bacterium]|nr:PilZ domain-containing protein [Candidatus Polarisedimenticolia bacterium]
MAVRPAMRDRRIIVRDRRRIGVRYGTESGEFLGYTSDLGARGLFLQANKLFPPGTILLMELELPDGIRRMRGAIRWVKEVPPAFRRSMRGGMGIELLPED